MINKFTFLLLGILAICVVFISGCVQEKAPAPTETATHSPTATTPKTVTVLIEDTDPSFEYSTECVIQENLGASGGSWLICPDEGQPPVPGAKITVTFTGTAVSVIHITMPHGGIAKVDIDGKTYPEIDMYSADIVTKAKTEIASNLQNSNHTLTFEIASKSNPSSERPNEAGVIAIDAIEITTLK